jgi:hypothetical protein
MISINLHNHRSSYDSAKSLTVGVFIYHLFLFFFLLCFTQIAFAQSSSSELSLKQLLLTPGKLTQPHAKFENNCKKCHLHFDKQNQSPLCLDCHKIVKKDLQDKTGFHSKLPQEKIAQCNSCHTDHQGREFNITALDKSLFDHKQTNFPLKGHHQSLICSDCHKATEKNFRKKSTECTACHEDQHKGKLADKNAKCTKCHSQTSWKIKDFDHTKTHFKLTGKHQKIRCTACHVNDVAVEIGDKCSNCHKGNDKHFNVFGDKCDSCHSTKAWAKTKFNHDTDTDFKLKDKHQKVACSSCHAKLLKPKTSCNNCHSKDDVHAGSNGQKCEQCHNNKTWKKTAFDHDKDTDFHIIGAHKKLNCDACHLPEEKLVSAKNKSTKSTVRKCNDCHNIVDPHLGHLGTDCQQCHQQQKWQKNVKFNHDFTKFPLTGGHKLLICESCHNSKTFIVKSFNCSDCHNQDDIHEGVMGTKCDQCHNSASWSSWQFDHDTQTDFSLEGSHRNLTCELCHNQTLEKPLAPAKNCFACHKNDDIHQGSFGRNCKQCHNSEHFYDFQH